MDRIVLKNNGVKCSPSVVETSMCPNIDGNYSEYAYTGRRIIVRTQQTFGIKPFASMQGSLQGFAIYGNLAIRMSAGNTHYVYTISQNGFVLRATFSASAGHGNTVQFAPTVESGETYPYFYSANLPDKCTVFRITSNYSVSQVQTITIASGLVEGGNLIIGQDGYMWYCGVASNDSWRVVQFRRVLPTEGDVTLTSSDIIEDWTTAEKWPYSQYVFQGSKFKNGQYWQSYGINGTTGKRGIVVYDTATREMIAAIDFSSFADFEPEDFDFWDNSVILCSNGQQTYQLQF